MEHEPPTVSSLDDHYSTLVISTLATLQHRLLEERQREVAKHEQELSALRAENELLQQRVSAIEKGKANGSVVELPVVETNAVTGKDNSAAHAGPEVDSNREPVSPGPQRSPQQAVLDGVVGQLETKTAEGEDLATDPDKDFAAKRAASSLKKSTTKETLAAEHTLNIIQRVVFTQTFEIASGMVILANTVVMALRLQYDAIDIGYNIQEECGLSLSGKDYRLCLVDSGKFRSTAPNTWPHAEDVFHVVDLLFNGVFIAELILRVLALKWHAWRSGWVWFDTIVVSVSAIDSFAGAALPVNPGMLRVLRLVRLVRLFKILKTMQSFDSLFLLQKAIVASMNAAVWSFGILIAVQLVVGLFLNQLMQTFLLDEDNPIEGRRAVFKRFGTFSGTMLTMFEITMANWIPACRCLVDNVSEAFILFFIAYRCFFCFAVLKVIAAVFITETNRVLQHDDELTLMKLHREKAMFDKKVKTIVAGFAGDHIGWQELQQLAYNEDVAAHLSTFGFHPQDLEKLFWLIDNGSGQVPVDLFLSKVGGLRGQAKSIDMLTVLKLAHKIDREVTNVFIEQGYLERHKDEEMIEDRCCEMIPGKAPQ